MPDSITFGSDNTITTFDHTLCCGYRLALAFTAASDGPNKIQSVVQVAFSSHSDLPKDPKVLGRGSRPARILG